MGIYIFSRPVHSGKTTELMQWCKQQKDIAGILMPDINGCRNVLNIVTNETFIIECTSGSNTAEPTIAVGRFIFFEAAFKKANDIITGAVSQNPNWLIIDECGKLELLKKGFYPAVKKAVDKYKHKEATGNLLLVIREVLCQDMISCFNIEDHILINHLDAI